MSSNKRRTNKPYITVARTPCIYIYIYIYMCVCVCVCVCVSMVELRCSLKMTRGQPEEQPDAAEFEVVASNTKCLLGISRR